MTTSQVRLKSIAFPPEHGSWGFLLEPIVLGLLVAPSLAGVFLSLAALGAFLARHPLKFVITDHRKGKRYPRTVAAERFALVYSVVALVGAGITVLLAGFEMLLPLVIAVPFALAQVVDYVQNKGRDLVPELAGSCAIAVTASCLVLAGGGSITLALMLWIILIARSIPSILYVRARLRLEKGKPFSVRPVLISNGVALLVVAALALLGEIPVLVVIGVTVLFGRALYGLSRYRKTAPAKIIGIWEMIYGLMLVVLAAVGYGLG
jgi:hypothetical protein